jgi:hypothetical protein
MRSSIVLLTVIILAQPASTADTRMAGDTQFVAIDLTPVTLPAAKGVEPSPFIFWHDNITDRFGSWIMTLDSDNGMQLGQKLDILLPAAHTPVDILWSSQIGVSTLRGVEPSPFHLFSDFYIYAYPVSWGSDGTPTAGSPVMFYPAVTPEMYGYATCMAELPGTEFTDGMPRLCIGTDEGFVIVLMNTFPGELLFDQVLLMSDIAIVDLEPIPQYGYIALGVLTNNMIYGLDLDAPMKNGENGERWLQMFILHDPRLTVLTDFDVFGEKDMQLPEPTQSLPIILADGSSDLALASISAQQSESEILDITIDSRAEGVRSIATGSLLMIPTDGSRAEYDPAYSGQDGSSGCEVDVTDSINDGCGFETYCGDADSDEGINVADVVYLINYIFKGGPAPEPLCKGDADADGAVNIADAVFLINYIFKGGFAPMTTCCL